MIPANVINGLFTIAGVIVGAAVPIVVAHLNRKHEEKRQIRELGLRVGIANFEHAMVQGQKLADKSKEITIVKPLHLFVREGIQLVEIVSDTKLSPQEMATRMEDERKFSQQIIQNIDPRNAYFR